MEEIIEVCYVDFVTMCPFHCQCKNCPKNLAHQKKREEANKAAAKSCA